MKELLTCEQLNWVEETWKRVEEKLAIVVLRSGDKIPFWSNNGIHDDRKADEINCWTNGFWPGLMWLMHVATEDKRYRETDQRRRHRRGDRRPRYAASNSNTAGIQK